jgi:3-deoxy-7-phosphoheptulonate synthase
MAATALKHSHIRQK